MTAWYTQQEACAALGVRQQTLYAYASRGQIEVCPDPANPRRSLYRAEDITALVRKRERGRTRDSIAASTMSWGEPIIPTRISTISHNRLFYRGTDAVALAATATLEEAAQLLWAAEKQPHFPACACDMTPSLPRARAYGALGLAAAEGSPAHALSAAMMQQEAAALVGRLASAFVGIAGDEAPLHRRVARAWGCEARAELLRRALVLLADQELTSSAFAARVTASTGASLGACALAGLATLSGPLHGDATVRVQALLDDAQRSGAEEAVRRWLSGGLPLPGFGHPLYPDGDPRAADLLGAFVPSHSTRSVVECVSRLTGLRPTIDVALAALVEQCRLPPGSAFALFAIGRSVGWMAHAMEQVAHGSLLRPRARYIGPEIIAADPPAGTVREPG
ncbi:Helix-turn-helix domain-containing protein [Rhodovastum atsumiense]|uniref:Helix-turn-helix domain-containing protein n=1 Tax=Rhodovastum atsumiense TaxID=504468 RepID=A0A5M6IPF4_9PROT|nr:citrate synthase family protein [Rhodovastum atsumiense]KAA5610131.1 helix-turn-helix domain-containing protein [Rhodovastum atsumiense]CAH2599220.1 Helix-turn-helix domain-containing protein [Rhodovastum atsumiense]